MKKTTPYEPIDISELSIADDEYTGRDRSSESKYAELFQKVKQGQRIVCPEGRAGGIAHAYTKWLKQQKSATKPIIRTKEKCGDGKGGVWWLGEREATQKPSATKAVNKPKTTWVDINAISRQAV